MELLATRQRSGIISADKLPPEWHSIMLRKLTRRAALERDAIVRSLQDKGGKQAAGCSRPRNVAGDNLPQDKRLRHRVIPLRLEAQTHWLAMIPRGTAAEPMSQ